MSRLVFERLIPASGLAALLVAAAGCAGSEEREDSSAPVDDQRSDDPKPGADGCTSELVDHALLCTTCPGDEEAECLAAFCNVIDRCLECEDPKGRVGKDCSLDYEVLPLASSWTGGGDNFNGCAVTWGEPGGSSGICQYPGTNTCKITEGDESVCIDCAYELGGGSGVCAFDPDPEFPDPMAGRPSWLPAPGECVNELGDDGGVKCSICTRDDLSAARICRFPPAASCDVASDGAQKCMACSLEGGGSARICDGAGT
jgi:hypothetical protein